VCQHWEGRGGACGDGGGEGERGDQCAQRRGEARSRSRGGGGEGEGRGSKKQKRRKGSGGRVEEGEGQGRGGGRKGAARGLMPLGFWGC